MSDILLAGCSCKEINTASSSTLHPVVDLQKIESIHLVAETDRKRIVQYDEAVTSVEYDNLIV